MFRNSLLKIARQTQYGGGSCSGGKGEEGGGKQDELGLVQIDDEELLRLMRKEALEMDERYRNEGVSDFGDACPAIDVCVLRLLYVCN